MPPPAKDQSPLTREERLASSFANDGFIRVKEAIPVHHLEQWQEFSKAYFQQSFYYLHKTGHTEFPSHSMLVGDTTTTTTTTTKNIDKKTQREYALGLGVKHGFREIVMRSPGRYELSLLECKECPPIDAIKESLFPLMPKLLGASEWDEISMCHLSLVISTPESLEQSWHVDGGHVSVSEHLPCHVANVFIPLQDLPMELGPTEFRPGTQVYTRNLAPMMLAARARKQLRPPVTPELQLGDAVIFDYRVLHRGKANRSDKNRAILVFTFSKPWFKDLLNFPARSMFDEPKS